MQVQIYDLASDSWSLGKDLPYSVGSAATTLIGAYVYLCGGILQATGEGRGIQQQAHRRACQADELRIGMPGR